MKKLFDLVVWQTRWIMAVTSDNFIPVREKVFYGNDSNILISYQSFKEAMRICRELRKSSSMRPPIPVDLGNGRMYTPIVASVGYGDEEPSFGIVVNDREFIF